MEIIPERRVQLLGRQLVGKLSERGGGNLRLVVKRCFAKYDRDASGSLSLAEFSGCVREVIPGVVDAECAELASRFDADGNGSISLDELTRCLVDLDRDPEARLPAPVNSNRVSSKKAWGEEEDWLDVTGGSASTTPAVRRGSLSSVDNGMSLKAQRRQVASAWDKPPADLDVMGGDDDRQIIASPGNAAPSLSNFEDRLQVFLAKLSGRIATVSNEAHAALTPAQRLPSRREALVRTLSRRVIREAFEQARGGSKHIKCTPTQMYEALARFRTPGQSLLAHEDARRLWAKCQNGDPEAFIKIFDDFEKSNNNDASKKQASNNWGYKKGNRSNAILSSTRPETTARARRDGTDALQYLHSGEDRTLSNSALKLRYKMSRTLVQPPIGWRKAELAKAVAKSFKLPNKALYLERCFGFASLPGPNLALAFSGDEHRVVYNSAAVAIVQDIRTGKQRYFQGHTDDVMCINVDSSGTLGATGQCASSETQPYVCVWSIADVKELRRYGEDGSLQRNICATCFFDDSSHLVAVGADDRHTMHIYNLHSEPGDKKPVIVAPCKAGVQPPAVTAAYAAPRSTAERFGVDHLVVTLGKGHLAFWLVDLPRGAAGYECTRRLPTYSPRKAPAAVHAVAFVHKDDAVLTAASDGKVYIWRDYKVAHAFAAHLEGVPCYSLAHSLDGELFTGGGNGVVKRWELDKGKYRLVASDHPLNPHDADREQRLEEEIETAFVAQAPAANVGSASGASSGAAKTLVTKKGKGAKNRTYESERASGYRGVLDLLLDPNDKGVVIAGMGFGHILRLDLSGGKQRPQQIQVGHHGSVEAVAQHPHLDRCATVGLDCLLCYWDVDSLIAQRSLPAPGTAVDIKSPNGSHIAVGLSLGSVVVYAELSLKEFRRIKVSQHAISALRYAPHGNILAVCSHDASIYLLDSGSHYAVKKRLQGHSSTVLNLDWSVDGRVLQTMCQGYEILYWDVKRAERFSSTNDSIESDTLWDTWTLVLGFPVMGVFDPASDGTDVNSAHRTQDGKFVLTGDDSGGVSLFNAPAVCRHAAHRKYMGHSSHCMMARWLSSGERAVTVGGRDSAVLVWRFGDIEPGERVAEVAVRPSAGRAAWNQGCELNSTADILRKPKKIA